MLRGTRVIVRATERADLRRLWELEQNNPELVLLNRDSWTPQSLASFEHAFEKQLGEPGGWFVIEADGQPIGSIGLMDQSRRDGTAQLGVGIFDPEYVGKGYGREAIGLVLDWAFRVQSWRRIWLTVLATNERAVRAYRGLGFVEEARLRQHSLWRGEIVDDLMMGLLRDEWLARAEA